MKINNKFKKLLFITPNLKNINKIKYIIIKNFKNNINLIQYRNKNVNFFLKKKQIKKIFFLCIKYKIFFIINDDINFFLKFNFNGIHIGLYDIKIYKLRKLIGNNKILGISCYNIFNSLLYYYLYNIDYITFSSFYFSKIKNYKKFNFFKIYHQYIFFFLKIGFIGGINKNNFLKFKNIFFLLSIINSFI